MVKILRNCGNCTSSSQCGPPRPDASSQAFGRQKWKTNTVLVLLKTCIPGA